MNYLNYFKEGSEIKIKKSHEGQFTDYCGGKVTEECIQKGKKSPSAKVRKQATFADNARHFKHLTGGRVYFNVVEGPTSEVDYIYTDEPLAQPEYYYSPEEVDQTETQEGATTTPKITYDFTSSGKSYNKLNQTFKDLIKLFELEGVPVKITSGYRSAGAAGRAGNKSHHTNGAAIDIVPLEGHSFAEISRILTTNSKIRNFFLTHNLGYIDETSRATMERTGATGKHFHIGPDSAALRDYANALVKNGVIKAQSGTNLNYNDVVQNNDSTSTDGYRVFFNTVELPKDKPATDEEVGDYDFVSQFTKSLQEEVPVETASDTVEEDDRTYGKEDARDAVRQALKERGISDENLVDALTIHAGAESGYNHKISNKYSSAYGLGQWIGKNLQAIVDHVNEWHQNHNTGKHFDKILDLSFKDLIEGLVYWYYDRHKDRVNKHLSTYDKVKYFAKFGLSPALLSGQYTNQKTGVTYYDNDDDWIKYFHDTGHDRQNKYTTFDDHIRSRYAHAQFNV